MPNSCAKNNGVLIAPNFTPADNDFGGKVKALLMEAVGFREYNKWTSEEYLGFLREQGWQVRKSEVLKASFPLTYAECVKGEAEMKVFVAFAFYLFYWLCCFLGTGTDRKNLAGLRSYPDAVQQAVRKCRAEREHTAGERIDIYLGGKPTALYRCVLRAGLGAEKRPRPKRFSSDFLAFPCLG